MSLSEFEQVTITMQRRQAVNKIANFYRMKLKLRPIYFRMRECFLEYSKSKQKIDPHIYRAILSEMNTQYWQERQFFTDKMTLIRQKDLITLHSEEFNIALKSCVTRQQYHHIYYQFPNFTQYLFGAFKEGVVNMNEMMTIKLMYDALVFFNQGAIPEIPAYSFQRFLIDQGPFQPSKLSYWFAPQTEELENILAQTEDKNFYHYYTIALNEHYTNLLVYELIAEEFQGAYIHTLLEIFIKQKPKEIQNFLLIKAKNYLETLNKFHKTILLQALFSDERPPATKKERDSILFLVSIEHIENQMPSIVLRPDEPQFIHFVLPTIDTLNLLQTILHGEETVLPFAVVGKQSPRLIRAFDEIPSLPQGAPLTPAQMNLIKLFPVSLQLDKPRRPIEITYPNIPREEKPHQFEAYDFMLMWHDLFHAWRSGSNFKNSIRKLRLLHDSRFGYNPNPEKGMSAFIWELTDMDLSPSLYYRINQSRQNQLLSFKLFVESVLFNAREPDSLENYLFLYSYAKDPSAWEPLPIVANMHELSRLLRIHYDYNLERYLVRNHQKISKYLQTHPEASFLQVYFYLMIKNNDAFQLKLIHALDEMTSHEVFEWRKEGLYFKSPFYESHLKDFGINQWFSKNHLSQMILIFFIIYLKSHHCIQSLPPESLHRFFETIDTKTGFFLIETLTFHDLLWFFNSYMSEEMAFPACFMELVLEKKQLFQVWNTFRNDGRQALKLQLSWMNTHYQTLDEKHIPYLLWLYDKANELAYSVPNIEFLLITSPNAFEKYLQKFRPEYTSTFIELSHTFSLEMKRHIFYNPPIQQGSAILRNR